MTHGDDKGIVIPPRMAAIQVVIVPILKGEEDDEVLKAARNIADRFLGVSVKIDDRENMRPGEKFFYWERRGIPVRIEIGSRDIASQTVMVARRDTGEKQSIAMDVLSQEIPKLLKTIQADMLARAQQRLDENTVRVDTWEEFVAAIEAHKFVLAHWDGTEETEALIKTETKGTIRCIPFSQDEEQGECIKTKKPSNKRVLFAKTY